MQLWVNVSEKQNRLPLPKTSPQRMTRKETLLLLNKRCTTGM